MGRGVSPAASGRATGTHAGHRLATPATGMVILALLANVTLRYVQAPRLGPLLRPFRQLGPLLATATALQPMVTGDLSPLGPTLTDDMSSQQRLRRMVRWVSHAPMLSDDLTNGLFEAANLMLLLDVSVLYFAAREIRAMAQRCSERLRPSVRSTPRSASRRIGPALAAGPGRCSNQVPSWL